MSELPGAQRTAGVDDRLSPIDVRLKVVALALEPALTLARIMALPLDDLHHLVSTGYFREARSRGMSLRTIARRFGKSLRTVATLSRASGDAPDLLASSRKLEWRRRLVVWLAANGPARLQDALGAIPHADEESLRAEAVELVDEGILGKTDDEVLSIAASQMSLVRQDVDHRLDSLRHFLGAVTRAIYRRFYSPDANAVALARVFTFAASREKLAEMSQAGYERLRKDVLEADAGAANDLTAVQASVAVLFVENPVDRPWRPPTPE